MYIDAYGYVSLTVDAFLYQKTKAKKFNTNETWQVSLNVTARRSPALSRRQKRRSDFL